MTILGRPALPVKRWALSLLALGLMVSHPTGFGAGSAATDPVSVTPTWYPQLQGEQVGFDDTRWFYAPFGTTTDDPPTRYLTRTEDQTDTVPDEEGAGATVTINRTITHTDKMTGVQTTTTEQFMWHVDDIVELGVFDDTGDVLVTISEVQTYQSSMDDDGSGQTTAENVWLSDLYTPEEFVGNVEGWVPAFQNTYTPDVNSAYIHLSPDKLTYSVYKLQYKWNMGDHTTSTIFWDEQFTPEDRSPVQHRVMSWTGNGSAESPVFTLDPSNHPTVDNSTTPPQTINKQNGTYQIAIVPAEIKVKKKGPGRANTDRLIVKTGDTLEFKLSDIAPEQYPLSTDQIVWYYQQMQPNGSYDAWQQFGDYAKGVKFEYTTTVGGIFQVKAVVLGNNEVRYLRKYDEVLRGSAPFPIFTFGPGTHGKLNQIGVADTQFQIDCCSLAALFLGGEQYAAMRDVPAQFGFPAYPASPTAIRCNIFVAHRATEAGGVVPKINGYIRGYPPLANQWAGIQSTSIWPGDPTRIDGWPLLDPTTKPQPGWIIAHPVQGDSGHVGITDYDGLGIGAGTSGTVNKNYDFFDGTSRYRKFAP